VILPGKNGNDLSRLPWQKFAIICPQGLESRTESKEDIAAGWAMGTAFELQPTWG